MVRAGDGAALLVPAAAMFGLVSLYSKLTQVLAGGSYPVALRASGGLRQVSSCSRRATPAWQ